MEELFIIFLLSINSVSFGAESVDTELSRLLKDAHSARRVAEINPDTGEIEGYRIEPRTHLLEAILPGDVLTEVNEVQLESPADAVQSFQNLNQNPREIQLTRDGKTRKIHSSEDSIH